MPIIIGDKPIFRIRLGDVEIREVRSGNELTWGLYQITYKNSGPKSIATGYGGNNKNIPDYVWGYPDYNPNNPAQSGNNFNLFIPADATAAEAKSVLGDNNGYKSHSDGWYENNECLNYIPAITRDFHKDLTLYCKWRQMKYTFNGTYVYEHETTVTSTIQCWAYYNSSTGEFIGYYDQDGNPIEV